MKSISRDSLLKIFEPNDSEVFSSSELDSLMQSSMFRVKSIIYGIQSFKTINSLYAVKYPDEFADIMPQIKQKAFKKIYSLIAPVTVADLIGERVTFYLDELELVDEGLTSLLTHFEEMEEYEKCAHIKKIKDTVYSICGVEPTLDSDTNL